MDREQNTKYTFDKFFIRIEFKPISGVHFFPHKVSASTGIEITLDLRMSSGGKNVKIWRTTAGLVDTVFNSSGLKTNVLLYTLFI